MRTAIRTKSNLIRIRITKMTTEDWFIKFAELREGDVVNFDGLKLRVYHISFYGGCMFTGYYGEHFPVSSSAWDRATIEGKETVYMDSGQYREDDNDSTEDWKK